MTEREPILVTIGSYAIEQEIGVGKTGAVYRVHHRDLGQRRALKLLHQHLTAASSFRARFEAWLPAIQDLDHPNIVRLLDAGAQESDYYIVTELLGRSLRDELRRGASQSRPIESALHLMRQTADALVFAHAKGALHLGLKPENLLLSAEDIVHVTDLGVVQLFSDGKSTIDPVLLGSPAYLAPEQIHGLAVDARTDIFGLGVVMYELITGYLPFGRTIKDVMELHTRDTPSLRRYRADISPDAEQIILRCLQRQPANRFENAAALAAALHALQSTSSIAAAPPSTHSDEARALLSMPYVRIKGSGAQPIALTGDGVTVGRDPTCDIPLLNDPVADQRQVEIYWNGSEARVRDVGVAGVTRIGGAPLRAGVAFPWPADVELLIGATALELLPPLETPPVDEPSTTDAGSTPEDDPATRYITADAPTQISITPDSTAEMSIKVTNRTPLIEHVNAEVVGELAPYVVTGTTLQLMPGEQGELRLLINVPAQPQILAKDYLTTLHVRRRAAHAGPETQCIWSVQPFYAHRVALQRARRWAIWKTTYTVRVINEGNDDVTYSLDANAPKGELEPPRFTFPNRSSVLVSANASKTVELDVRPSFRFYGAPQIIGFDVIAKPEDRTGAPSRRESGRLVHLALIRPWMLVMAIILLAVALLSAALYTWLFTPAPNIDAAVEQRLISGVLVAWNIERHPLRSDRISLYLNETTTPLARDKQAAGLYTIDTRAFETGVYTVSLRSQPWPAGPTAETAVTFEILPTTTPITPTATVTSEAQLSPTKPPLSPAPAATAIPVSAPLQPTSSPPPPPPPCQSGQSHRFAFEGLPRNLPIRVLLDGSPVAAAATDGDGSYVILVYITNARVNVDRVVTLQDQRGQIVSQMSCHIPARQPTTEEPAATAQSK